MELIVFDLFCGLGGWSESFIGQGYTAIGFDIEAHDYGSGGYPGKLVLRDIRSINGEELVKEYGVPACIVASPPCQEFSYMAMPWTRAKEKMRKILADPAEQTRLTDLFNQCFRIQREVSKASGCYVPMVIENVRGAQRWVGKARWNFGSFYLWGDVPALMPIQGKLKTVGHANRRDGHSHTRHLTNGAKSDAVKQHGSGPIWFDTGIASSGSKSKARKRASAEIAKIPPALATWIAKCFKPKATTWNTSSRLILS